MTLLAAVFVVLLLLNVPLAFVVGISALTFFIGNPDMPIMVAVTKMVYSTQSFPLLAVPFFLLAGNIMTECGITRRLFDFCNICTGHMRGGLAHVNILLSTLMGGISGSAAPAGSPGRPVPATASHPGPMSGTLRALAPAG